MMAMEQTNFHTRLYASDFNIISQQYDLQGTSYIYIMAYECEDLNYNIKKYIGRV